jgi:hypothetical protein
MIMKLTSHLIKLITILLILNSCEETNGIIDEKVTNNSGDNLKVKERLQQWTLSSGDTSYYKTNYFYNEEKMIEVSVFYYDPYAGLELIRRSEIEYGGNKVIIYKYNKNESDPYRKIEFTVDNEKILEAELYTNDYGGLELDSKTVYSYSWSGDIIKAEFYEMYNEDMLLRGKSELKYTNNLMTEYLSYYYDTQGNIFLSDKEIFSYESDRLVEWIDYDYDYDYDSWENYMKFEYNYKGILINDASVYFYENNNWEYDQTYNYSYNNNGVLLEEEYEDMIISYSYDLGKGNYSLLLADPLYERYCLPRTKKGSAMPTFFEIIENNHFR